MPDSPATRVLAIKAARVRLNHYLDRLAECEAMLDRTKGHHDRQALLYTIERWRQMITEAKLELGIP